MVTWPALSLMVLCASYETGTIRVSSSFDNRSLANACAVGSMSKPTMTLGFVLPTIAVAWPPAPRVPST